MAAHVRELCFCGLNLACSWKNRSKHGHGWPKVLGTLVVRVSISAGHPRPAWWTKYFSLEET